MTMLGMHMSSHTIVVQVSIDGMRVPHFQSKVLANLRTEQRQLAGTTGLLTRRGQVSQMTGWHFKLI